MKPAIVVLVSILMFGLMAVASPPQEKKTDQAGLQKEAKISMQQAQKTALAKEPGTIKSKELEREHGKLMYSFDIKTKQGIREVNVDAMTGQVIEDSVESPADEAKEKQQEMKEPHNPKLQNPPAQ